MRQATAQDNASWARLLRRRNVNSFTSAKWRFQRQQAPNRLAHASNRAIAGRRFPIRSFETSFVARGFLQVVENRKNFHRRASRK
jgi:hypothetical protein